MLFLMCYLIFLYVKVMGGDYDVDNKVLLGKFWGIVMKIKWIMCIIGSVDSFYWLIY